MPNAKTISKTFTVTYPAELGEAWLDAKQLATLLRTPATVLPPGVMLEVTEGLAMDLDKVIRDMGLENGSAVGKDRNFTVDSEPRTTGDASPIEDMQRIRKLAMQRYGENLPPPPGILSPITGTLDCPMCEVEHTMCVEQSWAVRSGQPPEHYCTTDRMGRHRWRQLSDGRVERYENGKWVDFTVKLIAARSGVPVPINASDVCATRQCDAYYECYATCGGKMDRVGWDRWCKVNIATAMPGEPVQMPRPNGPLPWATDFATDWHVRSPDKYRRDRAIKAFFERNVEESPARMVLFVVMPLMADAGVQSTKP